jgi:transposase
MEAAMMGRQVAQGALFYSFQLNDHVPVDHLLRRIDRVIDFSFVRTKLASSYSHTGRPSIDPELMLRMLLIGYLFGIRSERRLCEEVHLNLAYRWFCSLDLTDPVPDHSTFSKNRHGRFREHDLHRMLFEEVVARCAVAGLVHGHDTAVDGSIIDADATHEKKLDGKTAADEFRAYERRMRQSVARPVREYLDALDEAAPRARDEPVIEDPKQVSPVDPLSGFSQKGGYGRYAYTINPLIDTATDCILDVEATPARFAAEVSATKVLITRLKDQRGVVPTHLAADKAYGSAPLLDWLFRRGITPHIPVIERRNQTHGLFTRDDFRFDPEQNLYLCPAGKTVPYKGMAHAAGVMIYRTRPRVCTGCALKPRCTKAPTRTVTRLLHEDARDKVRAMADTEPFIRSRRLRKRIERVFAHLKRNFRLDRLKLRGLKGAREEVLMAASAYNLQLLARRTAPA